MLDIHIVESVTHDDVVSHRRDGHLLMQSLRLAGIASTYRAVGDRATFDRVMYGVASGSPPDPSLAIHLSCHGDKAGFVLQSGESVTWYEFRQMLVPLNRACAGALVVTISSCYGLFGAGMALDPAETPFGAIVGPVGEVAFEDASVAFTVLYHHLMKGTDMHTAVEAMKIASGYDQFGLVEGEATRQALLERLRHLGFIES